MKARMFVVFWLFGMFPARLLAEDKCQFQKLRFSSDLGVFSQQFPIGHWSEKRGPFDENAPKDDLATQIGRYLGWNRAIGSPNRDQKFIYDHPCELYSKKDPLFSSMRVVADTNRLYCVRFIFREKSDLPDYLDGLKKALGKPSKTAEYSEEAYRHHLVEWRFSDCRVVYSYGKLGADKIEPTTLIFEKVPLKYPCDTGNFPSLQFLD